MHHKIDKVELLKHLAFIVCVGIISACVSIILCLCVNFAYHINQTYAWTLFLLPLSAGGNQLPIITFSPV